MGKFALVIMHLTIYADKESLTLNIAVYAAQSLRHMSPEGHFGGWVILLWYRRISLGLHLDCLEQGAPNQMRGV